KCFSLDGKHGIGDPGVVCATCPLGGRDAWGTADNGGKACKEYQVIVVLLPDLPLPVMVWAPPASLRPKGSYQGVRGPLMRLAFAPGGSFAREVKLSLERAENKGGQPY